MHATSVYSRISAIFTNTGIYCSLIYSVTILVKKKKSFPLILLSLVVSIIKLKS